MRLYSVSQQLQANLVHLIFFAGRLIIFPKDVPKGVKGTKPEDPSSIPRPHMVEGGTLSQYAHCGMHMVTLTHKSTGKIGAGAGAGEEQQDLPLQKQQYVGKHF